jgi:hypothetical protein
MAEYVNTYHVPLDYQHETDELLDMRKDATRAAATQAGICVEAVTSYTTPHVTEGYAMLWVVATGARHD